MDHQSSAVGAAARPAHSTRGGRGLAHPVGTAGIGWAGPAVLLALLGVEPAVAQPPATAESARAPAAFGDRAGQDALAYRLELDVDPRARRLRGLVRYRFRAARPLSSIRLDARRGPQWSVTFEDPEARPLVAQWGDGFVDVEVGPVAPGAEVAFLARLRGTPPDGFYFRPSRYGDPLAFTDHYSIRARGWLPCEDHPADRARFELRLTFPAGMKAVASGGRVETAGPAPEGRSVLETATRTDIPPYMFAIVVGDYAEVVEKGDPRLVPHLVYPEDVAHARPLLVHHAAWLRRMESAFGEYPFAKYMVVQCPTRWGGFEAPGNVLISERLFDPDVQGVGTLAHELVHMWFGDGVGYAHWRDVWLSEGFASYFGPWLLADRGGPPLREALRAMRARWLRAPEGRTKAILWDGYTNPDEVLNANTYPKAAWVLHMLRGELGEDAFLAALRAYYARFRGRSVTTRDFVRSVERSTGRELGWFFAQWLERPGCPVLRVTPRAGSVVVEQLQDTAPYRLRLPFAWKDARGRAHRATFDVTARRVELRLPGARVETIVFDPDVEVLYRPAGG